MRLFCITISLALCLSGCRTHIQYVPVKSKHDSVYIDRLVPYPVPADSATIKALVECDKMGKVVLRWLDMANSRNVDLQFKLDSLGYVIAYISRQGKYMSISTLKSLLKSLSKSNEDFQYGSRCA